MQKTSTGTVAKLSKEPTSLQARQHPVLKRMMSNSNTDERLSFSKLSRCSYSSRKADITLHRPVPKTPYKHISPFEILPPTLIKTKDRKMKITLKKPASPRSDLASRTTLASKGDRDELKINPKQIEEVYKGLNKENGEEEKETNTQFMIKSRLMEQFRLQEENHFKKFGINQRYHATMIGHMLQVAPGKSGATEKRNPVKTKTAR